MAIQFQCPSCQATIRVPDAAAGKKGTCPRCNEKLLVPNVGAGPAPSAEAAVGRQSSRPVAEASSPPPGIGLPPLEPLRETAVVPGLPGAPVSMPANPQVPGLEPIGGFGSSSGSRGKAGAKRGSGAGAWIVPVLCILVVAGFIGWFTWKAQPKLEGALTGHVEHDVEIKPRLIPGSVSELESDDLGEVLRHLKAEPAHWASSISKFTLTGTGKGVEVSVHNTSASHFVSITPGQNPALVEFVKEHFEELEKSRLAAIRKGAPRLFEDWKEHFTKNKDYSDQKTHRDLVLLPSLVSALGFHVEAATRENVYPCVYEDEDGGLYFLLPNATKSFTLRGRKVDGHTPIAANFTVKIAAGSASGEQTTRKKSRKKTAEEREAENEGMNPELQKSDAEETPDPAATPIDLNAESESEEMPADDEPAAKPSKSKTAPKKKPGMMNDGEMMDGEMKGDEMMDDEMPAKSRPKKKPAMMQQET